MQSEITDGSLTHRLDHDLEETAHRILSERKRVGWSRRELAARADVSRSTIQRVESQVPVSYVTLFQIAEAFDTSLEKFYGREKADRINESLADQEAEAIAPSLAPKAFQARLHRHIDAIIRDVTTNSDLAPERVGIIVVRLKHLEIEMMQIAYPVDDLSLPEAIASVQSAIRNVHRTAPQWVVGRVRAMLSDQAFTGLLGLIIGKALDGKF